MNEEPAEEQKESDSPFELDPDELKVWLDKQLKPFYIKKKVAETLYEKELGGGGFRSLTEKKLLDLYGLTPGAAAEVIHVRDRALKGKHVFCSVVLFGIVGDTHSGFRLLVMVVLRLTMALHAVAFRLRSFVSVLPGGAQGV